MVDSFMKKLIIVAMVCLLLVPNTQVKAETVNTDGIQLRDDLIFILLYPLIQKELEKQYGEIKQNDCATITQIKKLREGSYFFDVTVQVTTFEGAHNPPNDLVTITFTNSGFDDWHVIKFDSKRLKKSDKYECKQPL